MFRTKKRKVTAILSAVGALLLLTVLFFLIFAEVHYTEKGPGECLSVVFFEKQKLKKVDKIILTVNDRKVTITDQDLIRQIVEETAIATHVNLHHDIECTEQRQIDLYQGDQLIRSMVWGNCHNEIKVYEPDVTHWLFSPESLLFGSEPLVGYVVPSDNLLAQLNALLP